MGKRLKLNYTQRMNVAKNLRLLRESRGLTIKDLSTIIGWPYVSIWEYEQCGCIGADRFVCISKYYGVPMGVLMSDHIDEKYISQTL